MWVRDQRSLYEFQEPHPRLTSGQVTYAAYSEDYRYIKNGLVNQRYKDNATITIQPFISMLSTM